MIKKRDRMDARTFTNTDYQWMMTGTSFAIIQQVKSKEVRAVGYTAGARPKSVVIRGRLFSMSFLGLVNQSSYHMTPQSHCQRESMLFFLREETRSSLCLLPKNIWEFLPLL